MDESDENIDVNLFNRYIILQNNHRRLLGITTVLTEALESTIRGNQFDLEEILNECVKIYPELFEHNRHTGISKTFKQKTHNTQDYVRSTENTSSHMNSSTKFKKHSPIENYKIQGQHYNDEQEDQPRARYPHPNIYAEQKKMKTQKVPTQNLLYSENKFEDINMSNLSDSSSFFVLTPGYKYTVSDKQNEQLYSQENTQHVYEQESMCSSIKSGSIHKFKVTENEHSYIVNLPDSDNDPSFNTDAFMRNERLYSNEHYMDSNTNSATINVDDEDYPKENYIKITQENMPKTEKNIFAPFEIILQQNVPLKSISGHVNSNGNVLIQIQPENFTEIPDTKSNVLSDEPNNVSNRIQMSALRGKPTDTRIIITKHVDNEMSTPHYDRERIFSPKSNTNSQQGLRNINQNKNKQSIAVESDTIKNGTIDKLQQLSTGLKVKSDEMKITPIKSHIKPVNVQNTQIKSPQFTEQQNPFVFSELSEGMRIQSPREKKSIAEDYYKNVKERLKNGTVNERVTILQNLRLTLIHTLAKERAELITLYTENDILNIHKNPFLLEFLLPNEIVNGWDLILQQMILKLLNTICSIWKGRDYLTINTKIISCLQNYFSQKHTSKSFFDPITQDMLMAIFHKMSTRQSQQVVLVNSGIVEKIFNNICILHDSMPYYRLRHGLGILINVCTFENGRTVLQSMSETMLKLLIVLLKIKNKKIIPYIARLIYVLMANEKFHNTAKSMNLFQELEKQINISNKRLKLQLDVLKSVLDQPKPHEYLYGTEENFLSNIEAEMDELEEEVEVAEPSFSYITMGWYNTITKSTGDTRKQNYDDIKISNLVTHENSEKTKKSMQTSKKIQNKKPVSSKPKANESKTSKLQNQKSVSHIPKRKDMPAVQKKTEKSKTNITNKNKQKIQKHEIEESNDEILKSYIVLDKESFVKIENIKLSNTSSNTNDDKTLIMDIKNETIDENTERSNENMNKDNNCKMGIDNEASFVVLSENDSTKSLDININSTSDSTNSIEQMNLPSDIVKSTEMLEKISKDKNILFNDNNFLLNPDWNSQTSVFVQHGKVTEIEYDYCEETKEIQSPIKYDNIFKENRQSPYRSLLTTNQKQFIDKKETTDSVLDNSETPVDSMNEATNNTHNA